MHRFGSLRSFCRYLVIVLLAVTGGAEAADDCDPHTGDQVLAWVTQQAAPESRDLARADYDARTFNSVLLGYEDVHGRLFASSDRLDSIAERIRKLEGGNAGSTDVAVAIARERDSQDLLNDFLALRGDLDETARRLKALSTPPARGLFLADGLQNVGRETLMASLQDLGSSAEETLVGRYRVYMSVSVDNQGNLTDVKAAPYKGDMWDAIVAAGASYCGPAIGSAIVFMYSSVRMAIEGQKCAEKLNEQRRKLNAATALLPEQLIKPEEQFNLYLELLQKNYAAFAAHATEVAKLQAAIDARWKELFAYNAARNKAAHTVLTTEKVNALQRAFGTDDKVRSIFRNVALTQIVDGVTNMNRYLARQQSALLRSCGNVSGFATAENQADSLRYASAAYEAYRNQASFAPLFDLLDRNKTMLTRTAAEVDAVRAGLKQRLCEAVPPPGTSLDRAVADAAAFSASLLKWGVAGVQASPDAKMTSDGPATSDRPSLCRMWGRDGGVYGCSGGAGGPYGGQFDTQDDPHQDVLRAANDGGYSRDNRKVSNDIAEVNRNIQGRIGDLKGRLDNVRKGLPAWTDANRRALGDKASQTDARRDAEAIERTQFMTQVGPLLQDARNQLDDFLASPVDANRILDMIQRVGGTEMSLPGLPGDAVVPDAPGMLGISADDRTFGAGTKPAEKAIRRERMKAARDLAGDGALIELSSAALDAAEQFSGGAGDASGVGQQLVLDSAAVRYFKDGSVSELRISSLSVDGVIQRIRVENSTALPNDTLIRRTQQFQLEYKAFDGRLGIVRNSLQEGVPDRQRRLDVARTAESVARSANGAFHSGDFLTSERLLQIANVTLDLATTFIPELSLGRSAYELWTGRDLITDEPLSSVQLGLCALNIATIGGSKTIEQATTWMRRVRVGEEAPAAIVKAVEAVEGHFPTQVLDAIIPSAESGVLKAEGGFIKTETGKGLANALPSDQTYARVLPRENAEALIRGDTGARIAREDLKDASRLIETRPGKVEQFAFIGAAEDIRTVRNPEEMAEALQRYTNEGKLIPVGENEVILEWQFTRKADPTSLTTPIGNDWGPGFIQGGRTGGNLREWVIPNTALQDGLIDPGSWVIREIPRP